ncbi:MAG: hypothetical protein ACT4OT_03405 [Acidobacteriota bacterium]
MSRTFTAIFFIAVVLICSTSALAQSEPRDNLLQQIEAKHLELQHLEKQLLAPSPEDFEAYAKFLSQPDTGLTRLLPRETYDSAKHPEKRMTIHGGGSYFSFTRLTHEYGWGTQIGLEQGQLKTSFAGADYGMIADLGEIPLEALNSEHSAVKFLSAYQPAAHETQARSEYQRFGAGVSLEGVSYKTRLNAVLNHSYVLRGIHYSDSDVLVMFRVVRKDTDGSLIIAWKLLNKYPVPELLRSE